MASPLRVRKRLGTLGRKLARAAFRTVFSGDGSDASQSRDEVPSPREHTVGSGASPRSEEPAPSAQAAPATPSAAVSSVELSEPPIEEKAAAKKQPAAKKVAAGQKQPAAKKVAAAKQPVTKKQSATSKAAAGQKQAAAKKPAPTKKATAAKKQPAAKTTATAAKTTATAVKQTASKQSDKSMDEPAPSPSEPKPPTEELAEQRRLAHWEKTRVGVLGFVLESGGQAVLRDMHDYSERKFFIAHQSFSRLMEDLTDGELLEYDFDSGMATLTDAGRELVG